MFVSGDLHMEFSFLWKNCEGNFRNDFSLRIWKSCPEVYIKNYHSYSKIHFSVFEEFYSAIYTFTSLEFSKWQGKLQYFLLVL